MNFTVNALELATDLAEQEVINELVRYGSYSCEADLYQTEENGDSRYIEEAQDCFIRWHDYFFKIITLNKI